MKKFAYLLITVFIFSCTSNTIYKKPKDLIPRDSMVLLIKDMYIATSARHVKNKFSKKKKNYMPLIYEKYKIDSFRFENSNNFYTSKVETYNELISDVKEILKKELAIYEGKIKTQDSIRKVERKNDSIKAAEIDLKIKDSILIKDKKAEIEKIEKSIKKNPKDSITLKKEVFEIEKIIDSIKCKAEGRKLLKEKTAELKQLTDSLKRKPKNSDLLKKELVLIKKTIDSIKNTNKDSIQLKDKIVNDVKLKDSTKNKIKKGLKNTKKVIKPLKNQKEENNQKE